MKRAPGRTRSLPRPPCLSHLRRHRLRHTPGNSSPHFRAVFHHQGHRARDRPRPRHGLRHRQAASGLDPGREPARAGNKIRNLSARLHRKKPGAPGTTPTETDGSSAAPRPLLVVEDEAPLFKTDPPHPRKPRLQVLGCSAGRPPFELWEQHGKKIEPVVHRHGPPGRMTGLNWPKYCRPPNPPKGHHTSGLVASEKVAGDLICVTA